MTPSIVNMGGAQMYVRNKVLWLLENGWSVDIVSAHEGPIVLQQLKSFNVVIPELNFCNYYFSKNKQEEIVDRIVKFLSVDCFTEIVIESTCISISTWSEIIAEHIGAKHISYLLQERNVIYNKHIQDFFVFKHKRRELVSINARSLKMMFESYHPINSDESYFLHAHCNNVEADVDSPYIDSIVWNKYDYKVAYLSRLDKPFIIPTLTEFVEYANSNSDKQILLVLMGGSPEGSQFEDNIKTLIGQAPNINLVITGFLYPVPIRLLEKIDVFVSSAGSSRVCMRSGVPTITIDANDFKAIGVLGRTTDNSLFRSKTEQKFSLTYFLDKILVEKQFLKEPPSYSAGLPSFSEHLKFLYLSASDKRYFDLSNEPFSSYEKRMKLILSVIGAKNYIKLGFLKSKLLNKTNSDR